jgi:geranylgeranyl diphosphate synthase type I
MSTGTAMTPARPAEEVLAATRRQIEPALRAAVDRLEPDLRRITGYQLGWCDAGGVPARTGGGGGKALRPALTLLAAEAAGGDPAAALPAAVAVELVHNFSLVHDDVIDGDRTRRHRPTVWSVFGTGAAIVAGDAMLALALEVLGGGDHPAAPPAVRALTAATLALTEGQQADLAFERRTEVALAECLAMAAGKCGALLGCACALGGMFGQPGSGPDGSGSAGSGQVRRLREFGERLGVAFQLVDDLLGIWGDPAVTGKPVHADLRRRKKSLPLVAALTSGTAAGAELARLYHRDGPPLSEPELARAAGLVERAGARDWGRRQAGELLSGALAALRSAVGPAAAGNRAAVELDALARLAVHRDH